MPIIKVLVPKIKLFPLDYEINSNKTVKVGDLVLVPLQNKLITGIVWQINCPPSDKKLKSVIANQDFTANIDINLLELINKANNYYLAELGSITKLVLPVDVNEKPIITEQVHIEKDFNLAELSQEQQNILAIIEKANKPLILKGVTGSGKTEIYFHAVANAIRHGKQALIMLPEIALSKQIINRFTEKFGFEPTIWNSTITKAQKKRILRGIIQGTTPVVIGARSSLFLPYKNLDLIVIDEEHDPSYKQNDGVLYHARDMAVLRSFISKTRILLVSATPSIETMYNVNIGKYQLVVLNKRYNDASMPVVKIIDMNKEELASNSWISPTLKRAITQALSKQEQILLFLNRRGYAPLMLCKSCGFRFNCSSCSASMVVHKAKKLMQCHHCGITTKIHDSCPECKVENSLILCGPGIERITEQIINLYPDKIVRSVSRDQIKTPLDMQEILNDMEQRKIDILIGTQIITKGYHFPNLTLVGVIDADSGSIGGDLRANERTYQLIHQVGGRAGRSRKKGTVLIQTYFPENKVLTSLVDENQEEFITTEIANREQANMPPFTKMAAITISGKNLDKTLSFASQLVNIAPNSNAKILGPAESLMLKLQGRYRFRILVITEKKFNLQGYVKTWLRQVKIPSSYHLKLDLDPHHFV
ncbi:MAG: primosomal protein N' [Rickettsiaceae bacterium]|nr:primosomal protein N' [Rickettsiaceae bacterium]